MFLMLTLMGVYFLCILPETRLLEILGSAIFKIEVPLFDSKTMYKF